MIPRSISSGTAKDICPVDLIDRGLFRTVSYDCAVEFRGKIFFLANLHNLHKFAATPEQYDLRVRIMFSLSHSKDVMKHWLI